MKIPNQQIIHDLRMVGFEIYAAQLPGSISIRVEMFHRHWKKPARLPTYYRAEDYTPAEAILDAAPKLLERSGYHYVTRLEPT